MGELVEGTDGPIEVHVTGDGPAVVFVPSLGRGAADFADLAARVADAGFRSLCPEPRGVGRSTAPLEGMTMTSLADDVAAVVRSLGDGRATVVGHAFGNRVTRMTATVHPDVVESVVLLCCGGHVPPAPEHGAALIAVFDTSLSDAAHLEAVATAFFAPGHDAGVWADGWYPEVARHQRIAVTGTPHEVWWEAGSADVLVVQPADDKIALPANAHDIVERLGDRARLVTVPDAGHALLPEQPDLVAQVVIDRLRERHPGVRPG